MIQDEHELIFFKTSSWKSFPVGTREWGKERKRGGAGDNCQLQHLWGRRLSIATFMTPSFANESRCPYKDVMLFSLSFFGVENPT